MEGLESNKFRSLREDPQYHPLTGGKVVLIGEKNESEPDFSDFTIMEDLEWKLTCDDEVCNIESQLQPSSNYPQIIFSTNHPRTGTEYNMRKRFDGPYGRRAQLDEEFKNEIGLNGGIEKSQLYAEPYKELVNELTHIPFQDCAIEFAHNKLTITLKIDDESFLFVDKSLDDELTSDKELVASYFVRKELIFSMVELIQGFASIFNRKAGIVENGLTNYLVVNFSNRYKDQFSHLEVPSTHFT